MGFFEWNDGMSVKVVEIDRQHQKLIQIIDKLYLAMKTGRGREVVGVVLNELEDYTKYHFSFEEKYFDLYEYPQSDSHKKEHRDFLEKVLNYKQELEQGNITLSIKIMSFLKDWLGNHIQGTDKKYSAFFNLKGLH